MKRLTATLIMVVGMCAALFVGAAGAAGAHTVAADNGTTCPVYPISQCSPNVVVNVQGNIAPQTNTAPASGTASGDLNTAGSINAANGSTVPASASSSSGLSSLAFTGTDAIGMVVIALLLIGGGTLVVRASRRSPTT